jgi:putative ABC transport system permease protein
VTIYSGAARHSLHLLREGAAIARTQPIVTAVTALVIASVCAVILATVGQSAAAETRVLATIDEAGTRTIVVSDPTGKATIHPDSVEAVQSLNNVAWTVGLGPVVDVRNVSLGGAGQPVPARRLYGAIPDALELREGRIPSPGEAIAGENALRQLGSDVPALGVSGEGLQATVVGSFVTTDPLDRLSGTVLIATDDRVSNTTAVLRQIIVVATDVKTIGSLSRAIPAVVHVDDRTRLQIETPAALVALRGLIDQELAASSRQLLLVVFGAGLLLITVALMGAVAQRRRDFGRRRALGATRSAVVLLVIVQTGVAAMFGVVLGTVIGLVAVAQLAGSLPSMEFVLGVGSLAILTALAAAIPPGLLAALRDPVRILRVP